MISPLRPPASVRVRRSVVKKRGEDETREHKGLVNVSFSRRPVLGICISWMPSSYFSWMPSSQIQPRMGHRKIPKNATCKGTRVISSGPSILRFCLVAWSFDFDKQALLRRLHFFDSCAAFTGKRKISKESTCWKWAPPLPSGKFF